MSTKCIKKNNLNRRIIFLLGSLCVLFSSFSYSQVQGVSYSVGKVVTGTAATTYTVPYTITPADTVGSTFTANTTGGGTITLASGKTIEVASLPSTVQDAAGTIYQADDKGKLTKVGSNSSNAGAMLATANLTVVDASKGTVTFAPTSDMKYAFDAWQKAYDGNSTWSKRYETLPISGQSGKYRVSSKLMVPDEADKVLAIINLNDKSIAAGSVQFVNATGTVFEKKKITNNSYELSLVGGPAGDAQEVYALYPSPQGEGTGVRSYTLGKLLVATYEPKTINLALVPVNGAKLDSTAIARELKKVYEPLGIDFNLTTKDNFKYEALETASLKVEGSGLLSVYTEQMKALNADFVTKGEYDKNTIYLFAIDQPESQDGKSIEGVMPRGQQFGYLFVQGKKGDAQGLTAAHEIGHGVFQLQHTFSYSGMADATFSAANMMNYPVGEALSKLQWDLMHDPGLVISVFETDKGVEKINATYNYLLPSHKPFRFKAGDGNLDDDCIVVNPPTNGNYPNGTLYSFVIGNTEYFYKSEDENFHSTDGKLYENAYTPSSAGNEFRLIAQDATDKCAYYLVKRFLKTSNYSAPDLSITTDAKKYYLCTKGKIPLNGNQSINAQESALGNITVYDYSTGKNDKEFFTETQKQELINQLPKYAQSLDVKVNVYLLNTENPNYNQALAKANADTENKVIFKLNEAQQSFNLDYRLGVPNWLKDALPNTTDDCLPAYVNTRLDEVHKSSKYQEANIVKKIQLEYFTVLYHGTFGFLYCSFGEQAVANRSDKVQFVAGACHELLACVDVVSMVDGINNLIDGANAAIHQTNTDFYNDIKQTVLDVLGGKEIADDELLRRITPPGIRQSQLLKQNVTQVSEQMVKLYFTDCKNLCAYRRGQFSIIILPAIITGGEWAMVRSGELLSRLKTISTLGKTEEVATLLADAEKAGATITSDVGKSIIKDAQGDEIVSLENAGNEVVINGEKNLKNIADDGDLKEVAGSGVNANDIITENPGSKGAWNKVLNGKLLPNKKYQVGDYLFETNKDGLVSKVSSEELSINRIEPNKYQQSFKCKKIKDGLPTDDGGHIAGAQFGGPGEQINYVPMDAGINRAGGTYYQMETEFANTINNGGKVTNVEWDIIYDTNKRPTNINVNAIINGKKKHFEFNQ